MARVSPLTFFEQHLDSCYEIDLESNEQGDIRELTKTF
jgi:hypothetical protein